MKSKGNGKGAFGLPSAAQLEMMAEQQNFKQLVTIAYLNKLAELTGMDGAFLPLSAVTPQDDLESICDEHIIYDDREGFAAVAEDGTTLCPIVTEIMYDEEHGLNATGCADTKYGGKATTFRAAIPADIETESYVVAECRGVSMHIVVEGGRWYTLG